MFGIIVALYKEAEKFLNLTKATELPAKIGKKIYSGKVGEEKFTLILSGIGKVNAALSTQYLIDNFDVEYILNFGSVGGLADKTEICSYYAVDKCCQYDFDLSALDNVPVGYIQDYDTIYFYPLADKLNFLPRANLATSDRFTAKKADIDTVKNLDCSIFDMEGGAIAEVCVANSVPFYLIKGVTDTHGSGNDADAFYKNLNKVCDGFFDILVKMLSVCNK